MAPTDSIDILIRLLFLCLCVLGLSGCETYVDFKGNPVYGGAADAEWAKETFPGKTIDYATRCIGIPNSVADTFDGGKEYEWTVSESPIPLNIPLSMIGNAPGLAAGIGIPVSAFAGSLTAQIGGGNGRFILIDDKNHIITEVHTSGPADGFSGRDSLIGTDLLRGCRRDEEREHEMHAIARAKKAAVTP